MNKICRPHSVNIDCKTYGLLSKQQWYNVVLAGVFAAVTGLYFSFLSPWLPLGFALTGVALAHLTYSSRHTLPLPQAAILIATLFYVFAPITSHFYPSGNPLFWMNDPETYFAYAIPSLWATAVGWSIAFFKATPLKIPSKMSIPDRRLYFGLDLMIFVGMGIEVAAWAVALPSSLATLCMLAANMRYIGAFGWIITGRSGWKSRLFVVMGIDLYRSVSSGFFLNFLLWVVSACVVIMFRYKLTTKHVLIGIAAVLLVLPCFQFAKWEMRNAASGASANLQQLTVFGASFNINRINKVPLMFGKVIESGFTLIMGRQSSDFLAETSVRYNQGWIVARILNHVPMIEGYANGETVYGALVSALVPRFVLPDKLTAGGGETFTRFSGVKLNSSTSMNLGFLGEMYANFGYSGGIVACAVYAMFFGLIFQKLVSKSRENIMMLCFIPYVLNFAVVSEAGLVDVINYTVKALVVAYAIYLGFPAVFKARNSRDAFSSIQSV